MGHPPLKLRGPHRIRRRPGRRSADCPPMLRFRMRRHMQVPAYPRGREPSRTTSKEFSFRQVSAVLFTVGRGLRIMFVRVRVVVAFLLSWVLAGVLATVAPLSAQAAVVTTPGGYVSLTPTRLLDTRTGLGAAKAPVGPGAAVHLQVLGRGWVPAAGVSAVVLNVTVTGPTASGVVSVYADQTTRPTASNLNYVKAQTVPNLVIAPVGTNGKVALYNGSAGTTQLVADVFGYYLSGTPSVPGAYGSLTPTRLLDTRTGLGAAKAPVGPGAAVHLQVLGRGWVPAAGVSAVVLNVTVTGPTASGVVSVYADQTTRPTASNLNYVKAQTVPNLVIAPVGTNGKVALYNGSAGTTQLVADVFGYYLSGTPSVPGAYGSLTPTRLLDTRTGLGAAKAPVGPGAAVHLQVLGRGWVPAAGVSAVVLNVTVTGPTASGVVSVYADQTTRPTASNLNYVKAQTVPNLVIAPVGTNGKVALYNGSAGTTQLVADVFGYYLSGTPSVPGAYGSLTPTRLLDTRTGLGAAKAPVGPGAAVHLQVLGRGWVPAAGVSAVVLNVTVTGPTASGVVSVYADQTTRPTASNLNYVKAQTVPNLVIAPVGTNGKVALYNGSAGTTQLVADVFGYYLSGTPSVPGAYVSLTPTRLLDTRTGLGAAKAPVGPGAAVHLQVLGRGGVPAAGVSAVVLNVTVTGPTASGVVSVYADQTTRPTASNLNYVKAQTVPNLVIAPVGTNGKVALYNGSAGTTQL